jgi:hypothetical protein
MNLYLRNPKLLLPFLFILALIPVFSMGTLIMINGINFPYWDQWEVVTIFESFYKGEISFQTLISQQNESRPFFPRLVFISLAQVTHWDVRYEMIFTLLIACVISFNIYRLNRLTFTENQGKGLLLFFISNLLVFAPIQYDNWIWGIQLIVFLPITCITTCIVVSYSRLNSTAKFLVCAFLCTVSTFSYANGIIAWILVFPILSISYSWKWSNLFKQKVLLFGWIVCFILNAIIYFYDYQKPPLHPSFLDAVKHPFKTLHYFLVFIGSPFRFGTSQGDLFLATIVGAILILLFIFLNIYLVFFTDSSFIYKTLGWQVIGGYTVISAIITTLGRVGFGIEQALTSRYTTFSLYISVSLIYLTAIALNAFKRKNYLIKQKRWVDRLLYSFFAIFILLYFITSVLAVQHMSDIRQERLKAKACLLLMDFVQEECIKTKIYPVPEELKRRATVLNNLGFLKPSLVKSSRVEDMAGVVQSNSENGWFDSLTKVNNNVYTASGWAILPNRGEPADAVILTSEKNSGKSVVFTVVDPIIKREDVAKALKKDTYIKSGWQKTFSKEEIPADSINLNAWAFDANTGRAFKLNGTHSLK